MVPRSYTPSVAAELAAGVVFVAAAFFALRAMAPIGVAATPDSINYLEAAANVRSGHGLVLNAYHLDGRPAFTPFTLWPPLYPLVLALVPASGGSGVTAAASLNAVLLAFSAWLLFALLRPHTGARVALPMALVFMLAPSTLTVFAHAWSEALFTPLLLLTAAAFFRCLPAPGYESRRHAVRLLVFTALLAALAWCRYVGLTFALLLPFAWLAVRRRRGAPVTIALSAALYAASVGALLLRNWRLSGTAAGLVLPRSAKGLGDNVTDLLRAFSLLAPTQFVAWLAVAVLAAFACCLLCLHSRSGAQARALAEDPAARRLARVCLLFAAYYLGAYVILRTFQGFDPLEIRYVGPTIPLLVAAVALLTVRTWARWSCSWRTVAPLALCLALPAMPAVQGIVAWRAVRAELADHGQPRFLSSPNLYFMNYSWPDDRNQALAAFRLIGAGTNATVVVESPQIVRFLTGLDARQFPAGPVTRTVLRTMNAIPGEAFVVLTMPDSILRFSEATGRPAATFALPAQKTPPGWFAARLPLPGS